MEKTETTVEQLVSEKERLQARLADAIAQKNQCQRELEDREGMSHKRYGTMGAEKSISPPIVAAAIQLLEETSDVNEQGTSFNSIRLTRLHILMKRYDFSEHRLHLPLLELRLDLEECCKKHIETMEAAIRNAAVKCSPLECVMQRLRKIERCEDHETGYIFLTGTSVASVCQQLAQCAGPAVEASECNMVLRKLQKVAFTCPSFQFTEEEGGDRKVDTSIVTLPVVQIDGVVGDISVRICRAYVDAFWKLWSV